MSNPLISDWQSIHQLPPFEEIKIEHYPPAFEQGFSEQLNEIEAIVSNPEPATFANTIETLEASGQILIKVVPVFSILASAHTNDELIELQSDLIPRYTAHNTAIYSRKDLFDRVKAVYESNEVLNGEQRQLLSETHKRMIRSGAALDKEQTARILDLDRQLSRLQTQYGQNVLKDTNQYELRISSEKDLDGLPQSIRDNAAREAEERGHSGFLFTISRSSFTPFMQFSSRRDLREQMWRAYTQCANNDNEYDNKSIARQIVQLRAKRAKLLGYESHAAYVLDNCMASTPSKVNQLLDRLWEPAKEKVRAEVDALQQQIQDEGGNFAIEPWDWWYYTEKVRQKEFNFDSELLKPYFELGNVRDGAFSVANKLFGLQFERVDQVQTYHEDVEAYEVKEADGALVGLFFTDYFMRPSKQGGAWMNAVRSQRQFGGVEYPVVFNTCNFPKGSPTLLGTDEVRTLFHEFGHALHGLLSHVTYGSLSGTSVKRDFVELPSQIMEHWAVEPAVLRSFARHHITGEIIPDELIDKILESSTFNQGFATTEYLAASYLDMKWHEVTTSDEISVEEFESSAMKGIDLIEKIAPRYRSTYFQHIFSGGYSAGYYSYIWAEVLDADAYEEFRDKGIFDEDTAKSFRMNILESGGTEEPMTLYKRFKGREPDVAPLMKSRGLS